MAKENKKEISFVEGPIFQSLIRFALPVLRSEEHTSELQSPS